MTDVSMYDVGLQDPTDIIGRAGLDFAPHSANCGEPSNVRFSPFFRSKAAGNIPASNERPTHAIYRHAFITDSEESLIVTDIDTLPGGEFRYNFLTRAGTWNDGGVLTGAKHLAIAGPTFYVVTDRGVVALDLDEPLKPRVIATVRITNAPTVQVHFRHAFATAVDVTKPAEARDVPSAFLRLYDARKLHLARTYAYTANGADGLAIVDLTKPEQPGLYEIFNASVKHNDANDVMVGTTNASLFTYIADSKNRFKDIQLTSSGWQPKFCEFSPDPEPERIAWRETVRLALLRSLGLERDRCNDETGHPIANFRRIGPQASIHERRNKLYLNEEWAAWGVSDRAQATPKEPARNRRLP